MQKAIRRRCPKLVALVALLATAAVGTSLTRCSSLYSEGATAGVIGYKQSISPRCRVACNDRIPGLLDKPAGVAS